MNNTVRLNVSYRTLGAMFHDAFASPWGDFALLRVARAPMFGEHSKICQIVNAPLVSTGWPSIFLGASVDGGKPLDTVLGIGTAKFGVSHLLCPERYSQCPFPRIPPKIASESSVTECFHESPAPY